MRQQIGICAFRYRLEEIASCDRHAAINAFLLEQCRRLAHHMRQIKQYAARSRMMSKNRGKEVSCRATHVSNEVKWRKIVRGGHGRGLLAMNANHGFAEARRVVGMLRQVIEQAHAVRLLKPGLARLDRIRELAPGALKPIAAE